MKFKVCFFIVMISAFGLLSFGFSKKKKFLDYFNNYSSDTLTISWVDYSTIYMNPDVVTSIKGVQIDSSASEVFEREEALDIWNFEVIGDEKGPMAYEKIKLGMGYYLLIIRSGGEYWNSRFYGCLYNSGDAHITSAILLADILADAGYVFKCSSFLQRDNKVWSIKTQHEFYEPIDYDKYQLDSVRLRKIDIVTNIERVEEHYLFLQKSKTEFSMMAK